MDNSALITRFYESFAKADAEGMVSCYHDDIVFKDAAFGELKSGDAKDMWRMLIENSKGNLKITFYDVSADEKTGSANWIAEYVFSQTGRKVVNHIAAKFEFKNGKIVRHSDSFNLWKWARQALGLKGVILGWSSFFKAKIQKKTNLLLKNYQKKIEFAKA